MGDNEINIRQLKDWAVSKLPPQFALRALLLAEKDILTKEEFIIKAGSWRLLMKQDMSK